MVGWLRDRLRQLPIKQIYLQTNIILSGGIFISLYLFLFGQLGAVEHALNMKCTYVHCNLIRLL